MKQSSDQAHPVEPVGLESGRAAWRWGNRHLRDEWGNGVLVIREAGLMAMIADLTEMAATAEQFDNGEPA